jgi:non-ribosomal peptide synthetase component E (peptide arylation enzyme)
MKRGRLRRASATAAVLDEAEWSANRKDAIMDDSQKSKYAALMEESARLAQKLRKASAGDRNAIQMQIDEVLAESCRVLGLSETDIAASHAVSKAQVKSEIQREVRIGLALYQRALQGDDTAIARLRKGSFEFAVAIGEGAISTDDLRKLPFADTFATAGFKATKH